MYWSDSKTWAAVMQGRFLNLKVRSHVEFWSERRAIRWTSYTNLCLQCKVHSSQTFTLSFSEQGIHLEDTDNFWAFDWQIMRFTLQNDLKWISLILWYQHWWSRLLFISFPLTHISTLPLQAQIKVSILETQSL